MNSDHFFWIDAEEQSHLSSDTVKMSKTDENGDMIVKNYYLKDDGEADMAKKKSKIRSIQEDLRKDYKSLPKNIELNDYGEYIPNIGLQ
jgi:hypothetical protein